MYAIRSYYVMAIEHGKKIKTENIMNDYLRIFNGFINNSLLQEKFGVSMVNNNFAIEVENGNGFAEWWDRGLTNTQSDKLVIHKNLDSLNSNDFSYTILHEVYPGHGHFYNMVAHNDVITSYSIHYTKLYEM